MSYGGRPRVAAGRPSREQARAGKGKREKGQAATGGGGELNGGRPGAQKEDPMLADGPKNREGRAKRGGERGKRKTENGKRKGVGIEPRRRSSLKACCQQPVGPDGAGWG